MSIRLDRCEPDGVYSGGRVRSIVRAGRCIGVAVREDDGWYAVVWARPGKIRARWRPVLLWRVAAALRA